MNFAIYSIASSTSSTNVFNEDSSDIYRVDRLQCNRKGCRGTHIQQAHCADSLSTLRRVPSAWGSGTVLVTYLRGCLEACKADCRRGGAPLHAALETGTRIRQVRQRATSDRRSDCLDPALGRQRRAGGRSQ